MHGFTVCILVIAATLQVSRGQLEQKVARIDDFLQSVSRTRNMRNPKVGYGPQKQKLESRYAKKSNRQINKDVLGTGEFSSVMLAAQHVGGQRGTFNNRDDDDAPDDSTTIASENNEEEPHQPIQSPMDASDTAPVIERGMVAMYQSSNCTRAPNPGPKPPCIEPPLWPSHYPSTFPLPSWIPEERIIRIPHPIPIPHPVPVILRKLIPYPVPHPVPYPISLR